MSTHIWFCAWCGQQTACCNDEHCLDSGQVCSCDFQRENGLPIVEEDKPMPVAFCSLDCFQELRESMEKRFNIAKEFHPEWFGGKPRDDI